MLVAVATLGLAACTTDPNSVEGQSRSGDNKGFVAGDGRVEQLSVAQRGAPVQLEGTTVTGASWSRSAQGAGKVVVVNVWGTWCGPCTSEMPQLQAAWAAFQKAGAPVEFVGIDTRESAETAAAYLERIGTTYPSISDQASGGGPLLALQGKATTTPATLVLDRQGRIAARVLGETTRSTLTGLVDDVVAETS